MIPLIEIGCLTLVLKTMSGIGGLRKKEEAGKLLRSATSSLRLV